MVRRPPGFIDRLEVRKLSGGRWILIGPLAYISAVAQAQITVPTEFITDFASVPRLPLAYWIAGGRAYGPAVVHDWLYQHPLWDDRALADAIFCEALAVDQPDLGHDAVPGVLRSLMWSAVRAGGWIAWRDDKRAAKLNPIWTMAGDWGQAMAEAA